MLSVIAPLIADPEIKGLNPDTGVHQSKMQTFAVMARPSDVEHLAIGNCDIRVKRKISVLNETKQDEILFKPKV